MNMLDDVEFQIAKLDLGPDDILVVRVAKQITSVSASEMTARLERRLDLQNRVLVLDAGTEVSVVARSEGKDAAGAPSRKK
jgi:hypothetical protein